MALFKKKRGAVGWPVPQFRKIMAAANSNGVDADYRQAQTGTYYIQLSAEDGWKMTVRVADHADAYATADYSVDPAEGNVEQIVKLVKQHASAESKIVKRLKKIYASTVKRLKKRGDVGFYLKPGKLWYEFKYASKEVSSEDVIRAVYQEKYGYVMGDRKEHWEMADRLVEEIKKNLEG